MAQISDETRRRVEQAVRQRARNRRPTEVNQNAQVLTTQSNTVNERSEFMRITVPRKQAFVLPTDEPVRFFIMKRETETSDGSASNDEQFTTDENFINSPSATDPDTGQPSGGAEVDSTGRADAVLYDSDVQKAFVSVDFANDTWTYADAQTGSTLEVYYLWDEIGQIEASHWNNNETRRFGKNMFTASVSRMHTVDLYDTTRSPTFQTNQVLLPKEHLIFYINTAVDISGWDNAEAFPYIEIPVIPVDLQNVQVSVPA